MSRKYLKAVIGVRESTIAFEGLNKTRTLKQEQEWAQIADTAEHDRLHNVEGMDVYEPRHQKCMTPFLLCINEDITDK